MLIAIPIFNGRVSPRCTIAESVALLRISQNAPVSESELELKDKTWLGLLKLLTQRRVNKLVCGGINTGDKEMALSGGISVIDNVAGSKKEIFEAIKKNGFNNGLWDYCLAKSSLKPDIIDVNDNPPDFKLDCLACASKECEKGKGCPYLRNNSFEIADTAEIKMLETAMDISLEEERTLCRLSELVYFALGMKYKKIGIAYCTELTEPTEILSSVLRRFFDVYPVCCKAGGSTLSDYTNGSAKVSCSPSAQAEILNKIGTDLNVMVGLCIGTDCLFSNASEAPCTTLFVKDKSLANNPIGAIYSDYYLKEASGERI